MRERTRTYTNELEHTLVSLCWVNVMFPHLECYILSLSVTVEPKNENSALCRFSLEVALQRLQCVTHVPLQWRGEELLRRYGMPTFMTRCEVQLEEMSSH